MQRVMIQHDTSHGNILTPIGNILTPIGNILIPIGNIQTPVGNAVAKSVNEAMTDALSNASDLKLIFGDNIGPLPN